MCCSESQNWLIITVLKFTRNPISIVVYIKTGQRNTIYHRDNDKARKSSEHGPENGKRKFNQTRRRSDNGRSARVDCHIYRKRNKYRQSRCYTFSAFAWTLHFFQFCHQRGKRCNLFSFSLFANAMTVLTGEFEMAFWGARSGWKQIILLLFSFFLFLFYYAIQGKSISWLVNSALNCTWKLLSHSSLRDIGFRV